MSDQNKTTKPSSPAAGSASREQRLYDARKRITQYAQPERLRRDAAKLYGLSGEEAIA